MIDLSYLTEEEQEIILAVLKRDTELKQAEEQRIKKLQKTERDKVKLKYLTGEWFYETKSQRHRDRIHGSDIIRASMRHRKPVTILELSEIWPEKPSFLNSERKDVFIPPELSGIIEQFPSQVRREDQYHMTETQQGTSAAQTPLKPRQNPFNSKPFTVESPKKTTEGFKSETGETHLAPSKVQQTPVDTAGPHATSGKPCQTPAESTQTPAEELPSSAESPKPSNTSQNTDSPKTSSFTTSPQGNKKLQLYCSHGSVLDTSNDPVSRQDMSQTPQSVMTHSSSSCGFTDSLSHQKSFSSQPPSPLSPESSDSSHSPPLSPSSEWSSPSFLERRQVRFSPVNLAKTIGTPEVQDGQEHREQDSSFPSDQEGGEDALESTNVSNPLLSQYVHKEKSIGEADSELLISAQSSPFTNEAESSPPGPFILSNENVGELLDRETWSDGDAYTTSIMQTPFDHHEDHAEPHSSQVSEPLSSFMEQGKALYLGPDGQAHTLTEEEGSSISKVLEWFGRVSKDSNKVREKPGLSEEDNKEVTENHYTLDTGSTSPTPGEMKEKPSPKPRKGLLALFSRTEAKAESPETKQTVDVVYHSDEKDLIPECEAPHTATNSEGDDISDVHVFNLNVATEQHEANILLSKRGNSATLDSVDEDETHENQSDPHKGDGSPSRLASLKSFWERGNKGLKILSIKKSADINPTETHQLSEDQELLISSSTFDTDQKTQEHRLKFQSKIEKSLSSPVKLKEQKDDPQKCRLDEMYSPVPSAQNTLAPHYTEPATISNLKSFLERKKSDPDINISILENIPAISEMTSPLDVSSTSLNPVESPERRKSSLTRKAGMSMLSPSENIERNQGRQSPTGVPVILVRTAQDDSDGLSPRAHQIFPLKSHTSVSDKDKKLSSGSFLNSGLFDHSCQSVEDNPLNVQAQSRTPSPRHPSKVQPRDLYPVKESKKKGSPLRAFHFNINPTERMGAECLEDAFLSRDQNESPARESNTDKLNLIIDEKELAENPEQHLRIMIQQSPSSFERLQSSGKIGVGNKGEKKTSPVHSSPKSQGQTLAQIASTEYHKRTSYACTDRTPVRMGQLKHLGELQTDILLARSYNPLSYQHYLGLPESTQISGSFDQREGQEWIRSEVGEGSKQVSQGKVSNESLPSQCSQPESEDITFDSSRSASPEAWYQSRTSSACGSAEPSPKKTAQKQVNIRPISMSLENLATLPLQEERRKNEPKSDITLSVEDVSATPHGPISSVSDPEQMKMLSVSVPAFIQQQRNGRESDCTSVNSFYSERPRKGSTNTNLSSSTDLASMSSVSGSLVNIYGTDFGNVEVKGTIQFAINYVQKLGEFHIFIVQCRDLAVAEPKRNRSDPYVKCYLLPDKAKLGKRKTSVKKKNLNPTYNEILRYKIPLENLKAHTLNLSVWHNDTFGRNSFLGEVDVDLSEWDFNNTQMMDYALKGRVPVQLSPKRVNNYLETSGEMVVALRFLQQTSHSKKTPQTGEVQVWVKECKNLPARGGTLDAFVKCTVLPDTARKGRQRTRVVKRTPNPEFNHTMVYDGFKTEDLREVCVELTVWDHDRLSNHFIGGMRLGLGTGKSYGAEVDWMDSSTAEVVLWKRMIESQNEWVEDVIPLRMLIMARTMSK